MSQDQIRDLASNRRVLVVDDTQAIHDDFRKILGASAGDQSAFDDAEAALFGEPTAAAEPSSPQFELESALQGREAHERVVAGVQSGRPYAMAFVDMRMPPGWDGVETIQNLWRADPDLQVVVCTAYADYSWSEMVAQLGKSDRLLILKKPFDSIEVLQLASALTEKWNVALRERLHLQEVKRAEQEARAYAASLETVNRALEASKATAEAAAQSRSDFLSRMAHEVLVPLASLVAGSAEVLTLQVESEAWCERLERLCREGSELCARLEDVREISEIDAGRVALTNVCCSPTEIVARAIEAARSGASARKVEIEFERALETPEELVTDPERISAVLTRLIQNAVRSTASGSVRVSLAASIGDWQGPMIEIAVEDGGKGLTREQQTRIFEPFGAVASDEELGTRLGLALCKRLARVLGGDLRVESAPGRGSRFVLALRNLVASAAAA